MYFLKFLSKGKESSSTMSTNTPAEWKLKLSYSNRLVTYLLSKLIIGGLPKHQSMLSDNDSLNEFFHCSLLKSMSGLFREIFSSGLICSLLTV